MTGIYYRIERDGKWQSVDLADMTDGELSQILCDKSDDYLVSIIGIILQNATREELISIIKAYRKGADNGIG